MAIIPILLRELIVAARKTGYHAERFSFAMLLFLVCIGTFAAPYVLPAGTIADGPITHSAQKAFVWSLSLHAAIFGAAIARGAYSIAKEKDRRTLDFLLGTRLSSTEIILGKLAACLTITLTLYASGIPLMIVLNQLGGADVWTILLAYAALVSTVLFLSALSIWFSVEADESRMAVSSAAFWAITWMVGPTMLVLLLRVTRLRLPEWTIFVNTCLMWSSPLGVVFNVAVGGVSGTALVDIVGRMVGFQLVGSTLLLLHATYRLRPAFREYQSSDERRRVRSVWRFRPRPAVGDDPILWREKYTIRGNGFMKAVAVLINVGLFSLLAYATYYYGSAAFAELWTHGYRTKLPANGRPELNVFASVFGTGALSRVVDFSRTQFNVFIRSASLLMAFTLTTGSGANVAGEISAERMRETWPSLLATPLSGRDILRSKILAVLWRMRGLAVCLVTLWTVGLLAGALHPIGFLVALLAVVAWTWFFVAAGVATAMRAKVAGSGGNLGLGIVMILPATAALPLLLPVSLSSVLLGLGSSLWVIWLSLVSYRDLNGVSIFSAPFQSYPHLEWIGIHTGEGPLLVVLTCLIGILGPAIGGTLAWRYAVSHFDRLAGRPFRPSVPPGESSRLVIKKSTA